MRQYFAYGSVRRAAGNSGPYRDPSECLLEGRQRSLRFPRGASFDRNRRCQSINGQRLSRIREYSLKHQL